MVKTTRFSTNSPRPPIPCRRRRLHGVAVALNIGDELTSADPPKPFDKPVALVNGTAADREADDTLADVAAIEFGGVNAYRLFGNDDKMEFTCARKWHETESGSTFWRVLWSRFLTSIVYRIRNWNEILRGV